MADKILGRLKDLTFGRDGEQIITLTTRSDFRPSFDDLKDADVDVEIKKHRNRRSLDANAYAWVLLDKLAAKHRIEKTEIYRSLIREIGGNCETVCVVDAAVEKLRTGWEHNGIGWVTDTMPSKIAGCTNVILYYGSSTYDTAQMSRLIELIIQECKQVGIETATERELSLMEEGWL